MKWYNVTIGAYVENTIAVNAESVKAAEGWAKENFLRRAQSAEAFSIEFIETKESDEQ
jgi:hypothetical protein